MARIAGVDLPREKRAEIGLTYIFGIGRTTSKKILGEAGVNIAGMYVGREAVGKRAIMVLTVDEPVSEELLAEIKSSVQAESVRLVEL